MRLDKVIMRFDVGNYGNDSSLRAFCQIFNGFGLVWSTRAADCINVVRYKMARKPRWRWTLEEAASSENKDIKQDDFIETKQKQGPQWLVSESVKERERVSKWEMDTVTYRDAKHLEWLGQGKGWFMKIPLSVENKLITKWHHKRFSCVCLILVLLFPQSDRKLLTQLLAGAPLSTEKFFKTCVFESQQKGRNWDGGRGAGVTRPLLHFTLWLRRNT